MKRLLFLFLLILIPSVSSAQVVLPDCEAATIYAAYVAAVDHANLVCPVGLVTHSIATSSGSPTFVINFNLNKSLTLTGAGYGSDTTGVVNPAADTIIVNGTTGAVGIASTMWRIETFPGREYNISGIRIVRNNIAKNGEDTVIVTGVTNNFKWHNTMFDHCAALAGNYKLSLNFKGTTTTGSAITGVVYDNYFQGRGTGNARMDITHDGWNGGLNGDGAWTEDAQYGTSKFIFLEDNTFKSCLTTGTELTMPETTAGTRVVDRFNTYIDANGGAALHGTESGGRDRAPRAIETYNNKYYTTGASCLPMGSWRGGGFLAFNNNMSCYNSLWPLQQNRSMGNNSVWKASDGSLKFDLNDGSVYASGLAASGSSAQTLVSSGWTASQWLGYSVRDCGAVANTQANRDSCEAGNIGTGSYISSNTTTSLVAATSSSIDGNNKPSFAVNDLFLILRATKVMDAVGRGRGKALDRGSNPPTCAACAVAPAPFSERGLQQMDEPSYQFNNKRCLSAGCTPTTPDTQQYGMLADFSNINAGGRGPHIVIDRDTFGYVPIDSFTGASGVSYGTLDERPSGCTTVGVGYWATDVGTWNNNPVGVPGNVTDPLLWDGQGSLYVCARADYVDVATNATDRYLGVSATLGWVLYYEPYTYPHPLRSVAAPTLSSLSPTSGTRTLATVSVTLTGTGFNGGSFGITIDNACTGVAATNIAGATDTSRTSDFTISAAASGVCGVTVHTTAGTSTSQTFAVSAPIITSVVPPAANQGESQTITITGTTLNGASPVLTFSGTSITYNSFSCSSSTTCTANFVVAPGATPGSRTLTYSTFDGSDDDIFQVFDVVIITKPVLDTITPSSCYRGAKCPTIFRGTAFTGGTLIKSCSDSVMTMANTVVVSDLMITSDITVPATAFNETCDFQVTTGGTAAYVGAEISTGTSVAIPAHLEGDLILIFPYRNSSSGVTVPDATWTEVADPVTQSNYWIGAYYQIAAGAGTTSGTWTNANIVGTMVFRGVASNAIGNVTSSTAAGTSVLYPSNTFNVSDSTSLAIGFGCSRVNDATFASTAPAGMTNRDSVASGNGSCGLHSTAAGVATWAAQSVSTTSARNGAYVIEIGGAGGSNVRVISPLQPAGGPAGRLRAK